MINALSDDSHPCQALADVLTILERFGQIKGRRIAFVGEGNNVAVSLYYFVQSLALTARVVSPDGYGLPSWVMENANDLPGTVTQFQDIDKAVVMRM